MPKILLVEDDPMISEVYMTKFRTSGIEADLAETGKAVLQKAKENAYDLILLDIVLPEMNGMEVLEELRTKPEYDKNLKIVMFSNLSEKSDRDRAIQLGANGFVPKTEFAPSQLVSEVARFLRQFEEQKKNALRETGEAPSATHHKKILFVEDEPVFCDMFGGHLEKEGYELTYLDGGMNTVRDILGQIFDVIITDMAIREMNGLDVIRLTRESELNKATPIILFSASVDDEHFIEAQQLGANRCFLKTRLTPSELTREVNRLAQSQ
jgi:DNA-binding response OmpR family regulator